MSSNSAILFGRPKDPDADKRRGSLSRRGSKEETESVTESVNSDLASLSAAIREVENSPEHQAEKHAFEEARHELREVRQYDKPAHSGLSVKQRLRIKEQKKKQLNKGQTDFRDTLLHTPNQKGDSQNLTDRSGDAADISRRGSEISALDDNIDVQFTRADMRKALSPSRTYREELFYHEPPEPENLFEYEGHKTIMKSQDNNAVRDFGLHRNKKHWKQHLEHFIEHEHMGAKGDDRELFQERNGAGGEHYLLINGKPANPNKVIWGGDLSSLKVKNLLETTELPGYMTQKISRNPSESTPKSIKGCFDDTW